MLRYPTALLFMVVICLPLLNQLTGIWHFERKSENRNFRDSVNFDIAFLDPFPADFESYFNDNFSFRRPLLDLHHHLSFYYFLVSPHPDQTLVGSSGWYFLAKKEKNIYEGILRFTPGHLQQFEAEWRYRKHYLDSMRIPFMWLIAPMKHHVYAEFMPFQSIPIKEDRVTQLERHFNKKLPGVMTSLRPLLNEAKKDHKVFYKLDNHWNFHAGELVSRYIVQQLRENLPGVQIPEIPPVSWRDTLLKTGIHQNVLGIDDLSETDQIPVIAKPRSVAVVKHDFPPIKHFQYPGDYEMRFMNVHDSSGLRVLVIRDSFGEKLLPFLKEPFHETVFIFDGWQYGLNKKIIEHLKPDAVIFLSSEVHIEHIIGLE